MRAFYCTARACNPNARFRRVAVLYTGANYGGWNMTPESIEKRRARNRASAAKHRDTARAYNRAYRSKHREALIAKDRDRWEANKDALNAKRRAKMRTPEQQEHVCQFNRTYYLANQERLKAQARAYRATHQEQTRANKRIYNAANRHAIRMLRAARYARQRGASIRDFSAAQWQEIKAAHGYRCVYCRKKPKQLTMDHIIALIRGGAHTASNIVPACQSCNSRKSTGPPLCPVQPMLLTIAPALSQVP